MTGTTITRTAATRRALLRAGAGVLIAAAGTFAVPAVAEAKPCGGTCLLDGPVVAFARDVGDAGYKDIWSMYADGSGMTRLTNSPNYDGQPTWSPDRKKIAFATNRHATDFEPQYELYTMNANGTDQRRITTSHGQDAEPSWSPAGDKIAFTTNRDGQSEIYTMSTDGTNPQRLTTNPAFDNQPQWSPDGRRIVFASNRDADVNHSNLYVMNADGTGLRRLTSYPGTDYNPAWSKDGAKIAFSRDLGKGNQEIHVTDANASAGAPVTRVTTNAAYDGRPTWTPDGRIAFGSVNTPAVRDTNILVVNQDGSGLTSLTTSPLWEDEPNWAPVPLAPPRSP